MGPQIMVTPGGREGGRESYKPRKEHLHAVYTPQTSLVELS